jgi:hypothetical protein
MPLSEFVAELRQLTGRVGVADGVLPPLLFVGTQAAWGLPAAAIVSLVGALLIVTARLISGGGLRFAVAGLLGTLLAIFLAVRSGSARDYFLPGIISGGLTTLLLLASLAVRRPAVAWTSAITRGWPLTWYWHPRILPAYMKVTWLWLGFFAVRTALLWRLYAEGDTVGLGLFRVAAGWPALLLLLVATYVYGRRWLVQLEGPSVEEFELASSPPWSGQQKGF